MRLTSAAPANDCRTYFSMVAKLEPPDSASSRKLLISTYSKNKEENRWLSVIWTADVRNIRGPSVYLCQVRAFAEGQLPRVMVRLLVRRLSLVADLEDLGIRDCLVKPSHDHLVAEDRAVALGVRLTDGVAYPLRRRPLLLALDLANGFDEPFLPDHLAGRPRIRFASFLHITWEIAKGKSVKIVTF